MIEWVFFDETGQKDSFYMVDGKKRARRFDRNNYHQFTVKLLRHYDNVIEIT